MASEIEIDQLVETADEQWGKDYEWANQGRSRERARRAEKTRDPKLIQYLYEGNERAPSVRSAALQNPAADPDWLRARAQVLQKEPSRSRAESTAIALNPALQPEVFVEMCERLGERIHLHGFKGDLSITCAIGLTERRDLSPAQMRRLVELGATTQPLFQLSLKLRLEGRRAALERDPKWFYAVRAAVREHCPEAYSWAERVIAGIEEGIAREDLWRSGAWQVQAKQKRDRG